MGVEHDGMIISVDGHGCVTGFSIPGFFFSHQINDTSGKKELLKPPWIWKKGVEDSSPPSALDQKTVGTPEKARSYDIIEKTHFLPSTLSFIPITTFFNTLHQYWKK